MQVLFFTHRLPYINWFEYISFLVTCIIRKIGEKINVQKITVLTLIERVVVVPQNIWKVLEPTNVLKKTNLLNEWNLKSTFHIIFLCLCVENENVSDMKPSRKPGKFHLSLPS